MKILRTPDYRFSHLPDFPFKPRFAELGELRIHYVDEGPQEAPPVLLMHGEPTWCYLYRHMIPLLTTAGHRAVAPDLIGFGRSDKPAHRDDYTYQKHVEWMIKWISHLDLKNITLVCQDWGSLIGLRIVAEQQERFTRLVLANGGLPTGDHTSPLVFRLWQWFAAHSPWFPVGRIVAVGCRTRLSRSVRAAYDAPFPAEEYKQGARAFPALVPTHPHDPAVTANRRAWEILKRWEKPFLTAFSDGDPITRGIDKLFQYQVPGAHGQPHTTIRSAGHFLPEDKGQKLAQIVNEFIATTAAGC